MDRSQADNDGGCDDGDQVMMMAILSSSHNIKKCSSNLKKERYGSQPGWKQGSGSEQVTAWVVITSHCHALHLIIMCCICCMLLLCHVLQVMCCVSNDL